MANYFTDNHNDAYKAIDPYKYEMSKKIDFIHQEIHNLKQMVEELYWIKKQEIKNSDVFSEISKQYSNNYHPITIDKLKETQKTFIKKYSNDYFDALLHSGMYDGIKSQPKSISSDDKKVNKKETKDLNRFDLMDFE